jgi:hypothetical protein
MSAFLTPTIAIAAAVIGYVQWKTNDETRKNDLFDRRYQCYKEDEEKSSFGLQVEDLVPVASEAKFLFGDGIVKHIMSLQGKFSRRIAILSY